MKIAISQSNYIPWIGYFDNIALVDEFMLYDDMQYTRRDWRNRNKIKTANGLKWLSVPVDVKGKYLQKINETKVSDKEWNVHHWQQLKHNYSKYPCFNEVKDFVEELYLKADSEYLSEINKHFIEGLCSYLEINTVISRSSDFVLLPEGRTERLVDLCVQRKADSYYTGEAAKNYMDESLFKKQGIGLHYYDYSGYGAYEQLYGNFELGVTVLDLIFSQGTASKQFLKVNSK